MSTGSIQASLSRWFAVQTFVGLSIICAAIYAVTAWSFQLKQASEFERNTELVRHVVEEFGASQDRGDLRHKLDDFFLSHDEISIVLQRNGEVIYAFTPSRSSARWVWMPTEWRDVQRADTVTQLRLGIDVREDAKLLGRLAWTLLGAVIVGTLLVSLTGALLVRRGLRPLKKLAEQTAATGPEYPGHRIDATLYASEIAPWVSQFNAVLERAEQAYQQLESFNADVAHELRTPLANLIGAAEVELARPRSTGELQEALLSNLEEARRLSAIVIDMLFLSHADRGVTARRSKAVSLAEQVRAVAEFHEAALEASQLNVRVAGDAQISIDVSLVRRAVSNLLGNAIRYASAHSSIAVTIEGQEESVWLKIANRGQEIPAEALPHLFKRFFRAERSRSGSSQNHGLGLAIVAAIARMHGGETRAVSGSGITEISFSIAHAQS
ncbi:two-component system, OmpR family, heavy metal sensor histidine kinase CusS [Variovorax sp. CF079]|uniref:heavy metal sensor histidine kinase n=1 Tax=Variovorax sp. CF079 TaxID=1882774 RepID=UPI00088A8080|nr:heavy metal sensor histidine kinase [Variovorax sp. CF079]SDE56253.1 two-component system, OmpR family, heavy metal sensor histidine kinase CusS [Variovorax sp. CF079]